MGIGGACIKLNLNGSEIEIAGVALATLAGIILNLILPAKSRTEEEEIDQTKDKKSLEKAI